MTPRLGVVLLPLFVAACGLPPAVTIASFAIDAISLAVSEKTVADHALSQIAQKDCSMWRGFTGDELCIDEDSTFAIAAADGQPTAGGADSADLVSFTTASGPTEDELMNLAMLDAESDLLEPLEPRSAEVATASAPAEETAPPSEFAQPATAGAAPGTADDLRPAATADRPAPDREWVPAAMVGPGLYYVIGTFSRWTNAEHLAARHGTLAPSVVTAKLDGRRLFRVVIGPFGPSEQEAMRALVRRSGIDDAWAVRMDSADWSIARSTGTAAKQAQSIAQLTKPLGF
ncbi:MAG: SPOR domain-containing protein [Proteobacteria bacterium]|nr:SPOR domain-containing protein [Pseudomonadota bacterium]